MLNNMKSCVAFASRFARFQKRGRPTADHLDPEAELALADTLGLGGVEGIQIPAALALLLGSDLGGARQRDFERCLKALLTGDLAADVADQPAQGCAQDA